jgi:hypothetical protein
VSCFDCRCTKQTQTFVVVIVCRFSESTATSSSALSPRRAKVQRASIVLDRLLNATIVAGRDRCRSPRAIQTPVGRAKRRSRADSQARLDDHCRRVCTVGLSVCGAQLGWKGIPAEVRSEVWQLLVGYVPTNADRRAAALARKRREYHEQAGTFPVNTRAIERAEYIARLAVAGCEVPAEQRSAEDLKTWNQISIDMPRAHPRVPLFRVELTQSVHRRILFTWALRHPASGYVQVS